MPFNNRKFLVFTGRDDNMECLELAAAGHRGELEIMGRRSMAQIKSAFKHMTNRKVISYLNQDIMGCHQRVHQAIILPKWTQARKYGFCAPMWNGNPVGFYVPIITNPTCQY